MALIPTIRIIIRRLYLILSAGLLAFMIVGGLMLVRGQIPRYQASTTVAVGADALNSVQDRSYFELVDDLAPTYVELAESNLSAARVIESLGLSQSPRSLAEQVNARLLPNTRLIQIDVNASEPRQAAAIANEIALVLADQSPPQYPNFVLSVDQAVPPTRPALEPVFTVVIASLASLLACGGLVVLVEALRDRFQTLDEVSVATEKPVLGLTPDPPSGLRWRWRRWRKPESITPGWEQRADPIWERATLLADRLAPQQTDKAASSDPGARSAVVIGLISPVYPQRAAFVGRHMAAAWAGRGERVLIVDTTFKSQLFVDEGQKLLSEADARHPTPITGLEMMNWPFSNAEVGHLDETRRLLDRLAPLRSTQDRIVLILPPLLDEQGSLSRIEIPDRLIMVLRLGETSRKHFRQAMEVITLTEAHMQALVVVDG